ncbi:lipid-transfer protein [Leifsonia kafniensis]|uniref:Lipid-transfer protein n=1 Tax=Leifsonia kafniensis TaxID=475957 RepID=A0ABP7KVW0_9MICO
MSTNRMMDRTAITGVGWTRMTKKSGESVLSLAVDASLDAISDAGLKPTDIDGLVTYYWGMRDTPAPAQMAEALGLISCRMSFCDSSGGAWAAAAIGAAAMAVYSGVCKHVLVYRAANARSEPMFLPGLDTWHSGQRQWNEPFGAQHPATIYGPHVSAWMQEHGLQNADLAPLSVLQRGNASLNRKALMTERITVTDHQESPWIVEPFRLLDCSIWNDGAVAVVVSATKDARKGPSSVTIRAVAGGTTGAPVRRRNAAAHWEMNASALAPELYRLAGVKPSDIDLAEVYDPFTGVALMHIEQFGLCEPGTSPDRLRQGDFALDGPIPVNTHGGHLSEGTTAGLGHVVEAVQQLRGTGVRDDFCDGSHDHDRRYCRQVRDPEFGLVVSESGDSALILRRDS